MEETLRKLVNAQPWQPIEFELSSGEWVRVESPDLILVGFDAVEVLDLAARQYRHFTMLHIREARHVNAAA